MNLLDIQKQAHDRLTNLAGDQDYTRFLQKYNIFFFDFSVFFINF